MQSGRTSGPIDPIEAMSVFRKLADATRVSIIVALAEHQRSEGGPLGFSELRRLADVDDSGRFNYHLNELVPRFIAQTEEGYRLRDAGRQAYALIAAGTGTDEAIEFTAETELTCFLCAESLTAVYEHDRLHLRCPKHEDVAALPIPPTVVAERDLDDLLDVVDATARSQFEFSRTLVCPECWGAMTVEMESPDEPDTETVSAPMIPLQYRCAICSHNATFPLRYLLADLPAVVAFHHEHGIDITRVNFMELDDRLRVADTTFEDGSARVVFAFDDDVLVVTVDETTAVVSTVRRQSLPPWATDLT